jgi:hypothetical protein
MKYSANLFESIKEALSKKTSTESSFKDFLKLEIGKTYLVRLIPNLQNPDRTIFHYYNHYWKSAVTNENISVLCPATYNQRCPIDEYRSKIYRTNDKSEITRIQPIKRNENWLVNVYVIKDPTNPENQNQIKILRYGKQLDKIITSAMTGDDAEDFGMKIFDLTEKGCNLRIKVEENEGGYPTYVSSKFVSPSELEGSPDIEELHTSIKNLDGIFEHKSYEEINRLFNIHFLGKEDEPAKPTNKASTDEDFTEDLAPSFSSPSKHTHDEEDEKSNIDAHIEDILKDL